MFFFILNSGHVDPGEEDLQTAIRETHEEAGLSEAHLRLTDFRKELHYEVRGREKVVTYWLAELRDPHTPVILSDEHKDYRWLNLNDACHLAEYADMKDLLNECQVFLNL